MDKSKFSLVLPDPDENDTGDDNITTLGGRLKEYLISDKPIMPIIEPFIELCFDVDMQIEYDSLVQDLSYEGQERDWVQAQIAYQVTDGVKPTTPEQAIFFSALGDAYEQMLFLSEHG